MGDLLVYIIVAIVAMWVGWHVRGIVFMAIISEEPERMIDILKQIKNINEKEHRGEPLTEGTELEIERVGNMLYAYVKDTNQFVAQAPDLKSLLDEAHKRFPTRKFFGEIAKDNPAKELA